MSKKRITLTAQTPLGYIITGFIMWIVGYALFVLATDSGSLIQWLLTIIAWIWGVVRIAQGIRARLKS